MSGTAPVLVLDNTQKNHIIGTKKTFSISSVANVSAGSTVYTGTFTGGGSNAYVGVYFTVTGFMNGWQNNGTFVCTASTTTTLTLTNANGVAETFGASAEARIGAASGAGQGATWAMPASPEGGRQTSFTWETSYVGGPASVSVSILVSNDNLNWTTIDTSTNTSGETRFVANYPVQFIAASVGTLSGGTSPTAIVIVTVGKE